MTAEHILRLPMTADYARLALRLGAARGHAADEVLAGTTLTAACLAAPAARITQRDCCVVLDNLDRLLGPGWPFAVRLGPETSGPLGQAVASAPSVGAAMEVLSVYGQSRSPRYLIRLDTTRRGVDHIEMVETITVSRGQRLTGDEIIMLSLHNMLETLVGGDLAEAHFAFRSPAPAHAALYARAFRGEVGFDAAVTAIALPDTWRTRASPFANPQLHKAAITALEIEQTALRADGLVVAEVERALGDGSERWSSLTAIAAQLGVSPRTLARRLRAAGTSYRTLRDATQQRRAQQLLAETDGSVEAISAALGYADPVAFNSACHRWFGMAPRAWRRLTRAQLTP
jgi:AraC-like DNA-binding protein